VTVAIPLFFLNVLPPSMYGNPDSIGSAGVNLLPPDVSVSWTSGVKIVIDLARQLARFQRWCSCPLGLTTCMPREVAQDVVISR